ncbi:NAD(P)/FAD-dependent oxidoreductase [Chloroflexota bacterium]
MARKKHLIIGSGSAGLSAAEEIRRTSVEDEIKLISAEDFSPYSPTALPHLLSGRIDEDRLPMRKDDYFDTIKATFLPGKVVTQVVPETKEVVYKDKQKETYDTLLIASGSKAMKADIKGLDKIDHLTFHTLGECRFLQQQLLTKKEVAIYGGGLVAIEVALALLEIGYPVKIIVRSRILRRYFDVEASEVIKRILTSKGAEVYEGHTIEEVEGNERRIALSLSGGVNLGTEVLIIALGVVSKIPFLSDTDIKVNDGIVVDRRMRTNLDGIYAAGDVAEAPDFFTGKHSMNQILLSAVDEGRIAGSNMVGVDIEYEGWISSNIFNFFGNTAFSVGLSSVSGNGYEVFVAKDDKKAQFKKLIYEGEWLVGAVFINVDLDPGVILYLIRNKVNIGDHKQVLFEQPKDIGRWLMLEKEKEGTAPIGG